MRGNDTTLHLISKTSLLALALAFAPAVAQAGAGHGKSYGEPGNASEVDRTVTVEARDIDFGHDEIEVRPGETVRFVVQNTGQMPHEFTIGPPSVQQQHRREMEAMMQSAQKSHGHSDGHGGHGNGGGHHGDGHSGGHADASGHGHANSVMVQSGETKELIWRFGDVEDVQFGCNVPGHYEAGMHGQFVERG